MGTPTKMTHAQFVELYAKHLRKMYAEHPTEYLFPENQIGIVSERMANAIRFQTYNNDGKAVKSMCKELGIRPLYKKIDSFYDEFVRSHRPTAADMIGRAVVLLTSGGFNMLCGVAFLLEDEQPGTTVHLRDTHDVFGKVAVDPNKVFEFRHFVADLPFGPRMLGTADLAKTNPYLWPGAAS